MYNLFLDDFRFPEQVKWINLPNVKWEIVRSYDEFVAFITKNGLPNFISFDHDLADEHYKELNNSFDSDFIQYSLFTEKTGYDCAKWLVKYCFDNRASLPHYTVHSLNPIGKKNILSLLDVFNNHSK